MAEETKTQVEPVEQKKKVRELERELQASRMKLEEAELRLGVAERKASSLKSENDSLSSEISSLREESSKHSDGVVTFRGKVYEVLDEMEVGDMLNQHRLRNLDQRDLALVVRVRA